MFYNVYVKRIGDTEDATAHGAEFTCEGGCPLAALADFVRMNDGEELDGCEELHVFDDDTSAYACPAEFGAWEVHAQVGNVDNWILV